MILKPGPGERLWDSWLFEWQGQYHLFYLASQDGVGRVAHAVGEDLLHWRRLADFRPDHWPFTGMVWRHEGRFLMMLGESIDAVQTAVLYESPDLRDWRRVGDRPVLRPAGPHYQCRPTDWRPHVPWRDPFVFRPPGSDYHEALICAAVPRHSPDDSGARLARARTHDFVNWELLPPLDAPTGRFYHVEVPEYFEMGGRHYVIFSTGSCYGLRIDTPGRRETVGTYYMMADRRHGPYHLPPDPLLVGAGRGRMAAYVGRTIEHGGERLLYHHVRDHRERFDAAWGVPKRIVPDAGGELHLEYRPGLGGIECGPVAGGLGDLAGPLPEGWSLEDKGLRGTARAMGGSCTVRRDAPEVHLQCRIISQDAERCGVVLRASGEWGVAVELDFQRGGMAVRRVRRHPVAGWGTDVTGFVPDSPFEWDTRYLLDTVRMDLACGRPYALRCLLREEHLEVYLDDRWVFTTVLCDVAAGGDVALSVERGRAMFQDLRIADLEPCPRPPEAMP